MIFILQARSQELDLRFSLIPLGSAFNGDVEITKTIYSNDNYYSLVTLNKDSIYLIKTKRDHSISYFKKIESNDINVTFLPVDLEIGPNNFLWIGLSHSEDIRCSLIKADTNGVIIFERTIGLANFYDLGFNKKNILYTISSTNGRTSRDFEVFMHYYDDNGVINGENIIGNGLNDHFIDIDENELGETFIFSLSKTSGVFTNGDTLFKNILKIGTDNQLVYSRYYLDTLLYKEYPQDHGTGSLLTDHSQTIFIEKVRSGIAIYKTNQIGEPVWAKKIKANNELSITSKSTLKTKNRYFTLSVNEDSKPAKIHLLTFSTDGELVKKTQIVEDTLSFTSSGILSTPNDKHIVYGTCKNTKTGTTYIMFHENFNQMGGCHIENRSNITIENISFSSSQSDVISVFTNLNSSEYSSLAPSLSDLSSVASNKTLCNNSYALFVSLKQTICPGDKINLEAFGSNNYRWVDLSTNDTISTKSSISVSPMVSKNYQVIGDIGMKQEVEITVLDIASCYSDSLNMLEVITPNGDGINDDIFIKNIEKFDKNSIVLWNKWGQKVLVIPDYKNQGTKINTLPDGTYYYRVDIPEIQYNKKGFLIVLR